MTVIADRRVSPFGHPGLTACVRLPLAYRSLPRPSSPPCAQASPTGLLSLDYITAVKHYTRSGRQRLAATADVASSDRSSVRRRALRRAREGRPGECITVSIPFIPIHCHFVCQTASGHGAGAPHRAVRFVLLPTTPAAEGSAGRRGRRIGTSTARIAVGAPSIGRTNIEQRSRGRARRATSVEDFRR